MTTNAPKFVTWVVGVVIGALGILAYFIPLAFVTTYCFWFVVVGFLVLAISTVVKGL